MALTNTPPKNKKSKDKNGNHNYAVSNYNPPQKEKDRLLQILEDFQIAENNINAGYEEFGTAPTSDTDSGKYLSLIQYQNQMQLRFNNNIPAVTDDPNQTEWRANTIRPLTRNKVISIVAHITGSIIYPTIIAQNDKSEEDKNMSIVMRDSVEWAAEQMDYEDLMLKAVIDMCVNPAIIVQTDYAKVMKQDKEVQEDGSWKWGKEKIDELYSGFLGNIVPNDELYIANVYEPNIQKQDFLVRVKNITYDQAERKYGEFDNWKHISPGLRTYFDNENEVFYEQYDDTLEQRLVQEAVYYNRSLDLEIPVINGILMSKDVERPLQRKDKMYPFAKSYYEMFNSRFFYGMPLVGKLKPDQDVIDTLYNMIIDGTFLEIMPPTAIYGVEQIDSSVYIPGSTTSFKGSPTETKVETIGTGRNLSAGMGVLEKVERSAGESSQDPLQAGQQGGGDRTKYEVVRLEQNAKTVLGMTGKMVANLVKSIGKLIVGNVVQYMAIAEIGEITGDDVKLKFPTIFMPDRDVNGKSLGRKTEFTTEMPQSQEEEERMGFEMLAEGEEKGMTIAKVNPDAFRRMKYLVKVEPDFMDKATKFFKKLQIYDRAVQHPLANQEAVFRDFLLNAYVPGEEDKYIMQKGDEQNPIMQEVKRRAEQSGQDKLAPAQEEPQVDIESPKQEEI